MRKADQYQKELGRWNELFEQTDDSTRKAADGMIRKAAFLHSMCWELEQTINLVGSIKIHPLHPEIQKQVPAVKEYSRLAESYANIVNKLNIMRQKNLLDEDDELSGFE